MRKSPTGERERKFALKRYHNSRGIQPLNLRRTGGTRGEPRLQTHWNRSVSVARPQVSVPAFRTTLSLCVPDERSSKRSFSPAVLNPPRRFPVPILLLHAGTAARIGHSVHVGVYETIKRLFEKGLRVLFCFPCAYRGRQTLAHANTSRSRQRYLSRGLTALANGCPAEV